MKRWLELWLPLLFTMILLFDRQHALANGAPLQAIPLNKDAEVTPLREGMFYFEDLAQNTSLEQVYQRLIQGQLRELPAGTNNFGINHHAFWFVGRLDNGTKQEQDFIFELNYALLDQVNFYILDTDGQIVDQKVAGDRLKLADRTLKIKNPSFPMRLPAETSRLFAVRIETLGTLTFTPRIWKPAAFIEMINQQQYVFGLYYGMAFMMIIYNLFMLYSLRERVFFAYVAYISIYSIFQMALNGIGYEFFWSNSPIWSNYAIPITACLSLLAGLEFTEAYLNLKTRARTLYRTGLILKSLVLFLLVMCAFWDYGELLKFASLLGGVCFVFWLVAGFHGIFKGYRPARFFSLAWTVFCLGHVILSLRNLGWLPSNFVTLYGAQIGSCLEMIVLAIGIADRINEERQEAMRAKEDALRIEKKANQDQLRLNASFERFVPHDFIELLGKRDILEVELGQSVEKDLTTLFCDIRAYTTLSEKLGAQQGFAFLISYYQFVAPLVRSHHGVIDKYIGDAIMGIFEREADDAIQAGLALLTRVGEFNAAHVWAGQPIEIGIGINTGWSMLGVIGEASRLEGTVIGDAVNLAARLEKATVEFGAPLIITGSTFMAIKRPEELHIRYIGQTQVKGKAERIALYEVYDHNPPAARQIKKMNQILWEECVKAYHEERWNEALDGFEEHLSQLPDDPITIKYIQRCHEGLLSVSFAA
ncbi:MAG TPA: 7TM diverse intracellular signaling domain-containing protein [Oligoflexus sp.]|uniref:7TM diverse intracellular signaling domain-containing protein n=1 Tax=Oligoflexus sp. TaxID=1971216 RepID=UPI002D751345|nr:7TM diverse intracellular signaling domain-containing protein [Oligoflexus sp.]HYX32003.1 7TM diverse intracellular signaling domain-containing protein [Oligoflexus sp.]